MDGGGFARISIGGKWSQPLQCYSNFFGDTWAGQKRAGGFFATRLHYNGRGTSQGSTKYIHQN